MSKIKGALSIDKALHTVFEEIGHLQCFQPYGEYGRYLTYYAEERLYFVFDLWYHGFFLVEADSPVNAIEKVNCDKLAYLPKEEEDLHTIKETLLKQEKVADDLAELKGETKTDCRSCDKWKTCENGEKGHANGTSIGYSIGECRDYAELKGENNETN